MSVASGPQRGLFIGCLGIGLGCMAMLDLYFAPAAFAVGDDATRDGGGASSFLPSFSSASSSGSAGGPSSASVKVLIPAQARVPTIVARFDTAEKEPTDQSAIRALATAMIEDHDSRIVLEGHSDTQGGQDYNQEISLARAEWVKSRVVALGVSGDRIETVGLGSTRPLHNRNDAQAQNRRVEVRWLTGPSDPAPPSNRRPDPTTTATTAAAATGRPIPKASATTPASASAVPSASASAPPPATSATSAVPSSNSSSDLAPRHDTTPTPPTGSSSLSPPESNAPRDGVEPTGR